MAKRTREPGEGAEATEEAPDKRYYRIGEVSRITGVKPYVLRYWESEFRWMAPQKSRSKQRLYRRRDIDMILLIKKLLYEQRFTIAGARKKLRDLGANRALQSGSLVVETDHRARYRKIRDELASIRAQL
jgi:DNA-binding transcriptional MerR regulator